MNAWNASSAWNTGAELLGDSSAGTPAARYEEKRMLPEQQALAGELLAAAAAGDRVALAKVVAQVAPVVLGAVRAAMGRSDPDVDDLFQESLIAFIRSLSGFRHECSIEHYARRIALHRCLDARKRRRVIVKSAERVPVGEATQPPSVLPGESRLMHGLLLELPFEQMEVMLLRYVWEYGVSEIAEMTQTPVNTVRSRLRLARTQLRSWIERHGLKLSVLEGR